MQYKGLTGGLYTFMEWIMKLAYLNILWIAFTLMGLVVFGLGPSTAATFAVTRKWIRAEEDIPVLSTFWSAYRAEFWRSNLFIFGLVVVGYILYIDYLFITTFEGTLFYFLLGVLFIALFIYIILLYLLFPVLVHFDLKIAAYLKYMVVIGFSFPHIIFLMVVGTLCIAYLSLQFPALLVFFSMSATSLYMMWFSVLIFKKIEKKSEGKIENS